MTHECDYACNHDPIKPVAATLPAAPAPTERDEFESWYAPLFAGGHVANMPRRTNGEYVRPQAQIAWLAYSAALAARPAPTDAVNGDAIAKSKRILNLVDEYELRPTSGNRTTLRMALMAEFEAVGQALDSRDAPKEPHDQAKAQQWDDQREAIGRALKGPAQ